MTNIFGYMRFSFFGRTDTKLSRSIANDEERFNLLFNKDRMEERFYFFENVTVPSIRAQTDTDFKIFIISAKVMPNEYKDRLNSIVYDVPQIEVIYSSATHVTYELNPLIENTTSGITTNTIHFRLDDDDAICSTMVSLLRNSLTHSGQSELLTFPRGFFLTMEDGNPRLVRKFEPYIAIAWAYVNRPGQIRNPYEGIHNRIYHSLPSMMNPRPYAYIHVAHNSSDTRSHRADKLARAKSFDPDFEKRRDKIDQQVRHHFPGFTLALLEKIISDAPGWRAGGD